MKQNEFIVDVIKTLLTHLGVVVTSVEEEFDEKTTSQRFMVVTPETSILIGEGGTRLLALNHLMKRIVEKKFSTEATAFMVDVNGYQKKQVEDIRTKAHILAERARYFKSSVEMDPMSSYERMIVHSEFAESPDISTESVGVGRDRRIVLRYSETKGI